MEKSFYSTEKLFAVVLSFGTLAIFILAIALVGCSDSQAENTTELSQQELIQRGKYLTTIGACHDCHSPKIMTPAGPAPDPERLLSGHPSDEPIPPLPGRTDWILFSPGLTAFVGPWGISYAANLSPDDTGTGNWTFEQFKTAIRKGKYKGLEGSRELLPPMPWDMYKNMTDDDLKAIFVYLRSIKPVSNVVPAPVSPNNL
ncbi:MAG: diheme cytochrome c-553 [Cyclobacteriaceae bacterium]|nr:diheme cytochrome c-553 [Cyclobacteriaceae bacterium]